jgi:hypothetical protein
MVISRGFAGRLGGDATAQKSPGAEKAPGLWNHNFAAENEL